MHLLPFSHEDKTAVYRDGEARGQSILPSRRSPDESQAGAEPVVTTYRWSEEKRMSPEDLARFLVANGKDAASLVAAYELSGDLGYLEDALTSFPNNPRVLVTALVTPSGATIIENKREAVAKLLKSDPENSIGYFMEAAQHLEDGNPALAIEAFTSALERKTNLYEADRKETLVDAWMKQGKPKDEATILAFTMPFEPATSILKDTDGIVDYLKEEVKKRTEDGDIDTAITYVELILGYDQSMRVDGSSQLMLAERANENVIDALGYLDQDIEYGLNGKTVGQAMADRRFRQMYLGIASMGEVQIGEFLDITSPPQIRQFVDKLASGKQVEALRYANGEVMDTPTFVVDFR